MRPHLQLVDPSRVTGRDIGRLVAPGVSTHQLRKEAAAADVEAWLGPADVSGYPAACDHSQAEKRRARDRDACGVSRPADDENPAGMTHPALASSGPAWLRAVASTRVRARRAWLMAMREPARVASGDRREGPGCGDRIGPPSESGLINRAEIPPLPCPSWPRLRAFTSTYWYEIGAAALTFAAVLMLLAGLGGRR